MALISFGKPSPAPELYSLIYCTVNSQLLSEEASVSFTRQTGSTEVKTIGGGGTGGYAGEMPGAPTVELDVTNMVPAKGIEFNAGRYMQMMVPVEMGLLAFGTQLEFKGFIISDSIKHSASGAAGYDFKVRGGFADWQGKQ